MHTPYTYLTADRKKALEKLIQQCHELIAEAKYIISEFVALLHSCAYVHPVYQDIAEKVGENIMVVTSVNSQLLTEVTSGHPDPIKVGTFSLGKLSGTYLQYMD